ncbi:copper homeostasis periplasmic binding protein CopC [Croceicoccus sp. YJ47]|uniref:copper homeostasis periplasmic binding protein CopC n=1 Tax=Croceicoccus sp. YJ47 TaxID=2798724 RepID=UPI001923D567|nr:copper homeostasis periplasmic binding protein CopC [Croceicoccus sp. YJ47]QQN74933.1 copper homeostasis periplasmic binding protein CopC [Croceicoccus sp. YJ47]
MKFLIAPLALVAALAAPMTAMAHPRLVSATPAAEATVSKPTTLSLTFSEDLVAPLSGVELTMTGMPRMANHKPMPVKGFETKISGKTMMVSLPRALPAGTYLLSWHVVAADQHRIEGKHSFTVK